MADQTKDIKKPWGVSEEEFQEKVEKYGDILTSEMPWWKKVGSMYKRDIQQEIDLWKSFPGIGQQESGPHPALGRLIHYMAHGLPLGSTNKHIGNTIELGTIKAYGNALKSADDFGDTLLEKAGLGTNEYSETERGVDAWIDDAYALNDHLPPSQMTDKQRAGDEARASLALNVLLAGLTGNIASAAGFGRLDPTTAKTLWGGIGRLATLNTIDEIPSTILDDNRDSLFSKEGQSMTEASFQSFPWHLGISSIFAGALNAPALKSIAETAKNLDLTKNLDFSSLQPGELYKNITDILPNTKRAKVSSDFLEDRRIIRQRQIDNQIINPPSEAGETTFTDAINAKPAESTAAVESDAFQEVLERNASDQDLDEILTSDNVIEGVENTLSRPGSGTNLPLKQGNVTAPTDSLVPSDIPYSDQLGKVPTDNLLSLSNPENSPQLAQKITEITGKEFNQFDRLDVIKGVKAFEQEGVSVMPNRLMGGQSLRVDEISVDPARFQYKGGIDDTGVQKGGSLEGVDKWNTNMEGRSLVWEDPADGKTFIVEGHNRLQKAKELGIPSLNVDYLTAAEPGGARAQGALSNIAAGSGTPFDAAKFFKSAGINDPSEVANLGVPLKSGMATRGLALSKLPSNIFQDAVDGTLTQGRAIALGGSGLDEAGMQTAYKALKDRDITDATFTEVIEQAKNAPTVKGKQVDLFGNTDELNLMVEKGKLAAAIRKNIVQNKNLFKTVRSNADVIEEAGSVIDRGAAQQIKLDAEAILPAFDSAKYTPGKISDLLNEGALEISQGAKTNVVARRIQRQILDEIKPQKTTPSSVADEVIPENAADLTRAEKINQIVAKAAANGEVRPPATPLIRTPATSGVSLEKVADDLAAGKITEDVKKAIDDEIRLSGEFEKMDNGMKAAEVDGKRMEMGWDDMTFEQKKANGLVPEKVNLEVGRSSKKIQQFELPPDLKKLKPRYGAAVPQFESELDAVAYSIRSNKTKSKREDDYVAVLKKFGYSKAEVAAHGTKVHQYIKNFVKEQRGTAKASEAVGLDIQVPDQGFKKSSPQTSAFSEDIDFSGNYNEAKIRQRLEFAKKLKARDEADYLAEWGAKISNTAEGIFAQSKELAREASDAMRQAMIISGIAPDRIKYLDEVNMTRLFGHEEAVGAMAQWRPDMATFMARNPTDPLYEVAQGQATGVYIPRSYEKASSGSIYLALHPAIQKRYGGLLARLPKIGRRLLTDGGHEAFHSVQELLEIHGDPKLIGALKTPQAIKDMESIIRKSRGNLTPGMDQKELEAEAFGNWLNNRNIKLKDGGVKAVFERMKKYLNDFSRRIRFVLGKDPTWVDLFEMAASGDIARKTMINKLSPEQLDNLVLRMDENMNRQLPELTERIQDYLFAKKAEYDTLINGWELDAASGGCL